MAPKLAPQARPSHPPGDTLKLARWLAIGAGALFSFSAAAQDVSLTRLDCGSGSNDPRRFSDTFAYTETTKPFTFSCYVIRHGADVMVWDTGYLPGPVLLSGDAVHFIENHNFEDVPGFNFDRAQTLASIQRTKQMQANLKATPIIQHGPRNIGKLPTFPAEAK